MAVEQPRLAGHIALAGAEHARAGPAEGRDVASFWRACGEVLAGVVPHYLGPCWFTLGLYREPDREPFDGAQLRFLRHVAPHLADGARRGLLVGEASDPEGDDGPALVVLDERWRLVSASVGADRWLRDLPDADTDAGRLPPAVLAVAGRAASIAGTDAAHQALARVRTRSGAWVVLHGVPLITGHEPSVAVIIEPVHPDRLSTVLMAAYRLTERERSVRRASPRRPLRAARGCRPRWRPDPP